MSTLTPSSKIFQYVQVADHFRRQIQKGILKPGDRLPSQREMRERYGVNSSITEKAHALLEEEKFIVRSHRSGVYVAQPQSKPVTGFIGVCGVSFTLTEFSAYWTRLMEGIDNAALEFDSQIVLLNTNSSVGWDKVDGLLVNSMNARIPATYVSRGLPIISFFAEPTVTGTAAQRSQIVKNSIIVKIDDYAGTHTATEHLVKLGHRRIAYLHNSGASTSFYKPRLNGYADALREAGIFPDERWQRGLAPNSSPLFYMDAGRETMRTWLSENWEELGCTAILAHNDDVAWGVVNVLKEAGMDVPGQVSVVGYDGTEAADCCTPPLTTIKVPLREMGRRGVELLRGNLTNTATTAVELVLPTKLRMAASSAPPITE